MYPVNATNHRKKYCLSLRYNGAESYLFVNGTEIIKFKAKDSKILATLLCLRVISKYWSVDSMKVTGLKDMLMILVLIMMLLQLMILKIFISI